MSATSTKKKPLIFKRRAGPVSAAPIAALDSDSDSDPSTVSKPAKATPSDHTDNGGVDLFRRAKQFFPRAIEEQNQRMLAQKQRRQQSPADAVDHTPFPTTDSEDHETKRRKVSYDTASSDYGDSHDRQQKASPSKRHSKAITSQSPKRSSSQSSPQPPTPNKGKGIATPHTVNAQVVFSHVSSTQLPDAAADAADDSVVLLDNAGSGDEGEAIDAAIVQIKAEECPELLAVDVKSEPKDAAVREVEVIDDSADDDFAEATNPEFNEYIMRAQARDAAARAAQAVREAAGSLRTPRGASTKTTTSAGGASQSSATASSPQSTPASSGTLATCDQNYRIFITPHLPEPVPPLIATMRMDQKMHFVQVAFLDHARKKGVNLGEDAAANVVLTWKGIKIYSWTTGQSLDVHPDAHGKFRDEGRGSGGGGGGGLQQPAGFVSGGLHLEIWTQELYAAFLRDQERRRLRKLGEAVALDLDSSSESGDDDRAAERGRVDGVAGSAGGGAAAGPNGQRIRLVLKSRDHEKLNMTVYGDTKVATLIAAFREQRQIAAEQTIAIHWDGERLEEDTTVGDAEMEDLDSVEVFIH